MGNEEFWEIWERHQPWLYDFIFSISRNGADAEDALHTTALKAIQAWPQIRNPLAVKKWLARIAAHSVADLYRSVRKEQALDGLDQIIGAYESDIVDKVVIEQFLNEIPQPWRMAFIMRWYMGFQITEIAGILELDYDCLRLRLKRIEKLLRVKLSDEGSGL